MMTRLRDSWAGWILAFLAVAAMACKPRTDASATKAASGATVGVAPAWWTELTNDFQSASGDVDGLVFTLNKMNELVDYTKKNPNAPNLGAQVKKSGELGGQVAKILDRLLKRLEELESTMKTGASPNPKNEGLKQVAANRPVDVDGETQDWGVEGVQLAVADLSEFVQGGFYEKADKLAMTDTSKAALEKAQDNIANFLIDVDIIKYKLDNITLRVVSWFDPGAKDSEPCAPFGIAAGNGTFGNASCAWFPTAAYLSFAPENERACDDKGPAPLTPGTRKVDAATKQFFTACAARHAKLKTDMQTAVNTLLAHRGDWVYGTNEDSMDDLIGKFARGNLVVRVTKSGKFDYDANANEFAVPYPLYAASVLDEMTKLFAVRQKKPTPPPPTPTPPPAVVPPTCAITATPNAVVAGGTAKITVTHASGNVPDQFSLFDTASQAARALPARFPYEETVSPAATTTYACVVSATGQTVPANSSSVVLTVTPQPQPQPTPPPVVVPALPPTKDMNIYAWSAGGALAGTRAYGNPGMAPQWLAANGGYQPAQNFKLLGAIKVFDLDPKFAQNNVGLVPIYTCTKVVNYPDAKGPQVNMNFLSGANDTECNLNQPGSSRVPAPQGHYGYLYAANVKPGLLRPIHRCIFPQISWITYNPKDCPNGTRVLGWGP